MANKKEKPKDRLFSGSQKDACWAKAPAVPGRDPARWRLDPAGNAVMHKLTGCYGCACYDYDHIVPYSKGGQTEVSNCQILQTRANRGKSNVVSFTANDLRLWSCANAYTEAEMDFIEAAVYGNVSRDGLKCANHSVSEMENNSKKFVKPPGAPNGCYFNVMEAVRQAEQRK